MAKRKTSKVRRPKGLKISSSEFCIQQGLANGKITAEQARDFQATIERRALRQHRLDSIDAVTLEYIHERLEKAGETRRRLEMQVVKTFDAVMRAQEHPGGIRVGAKQVILAADRRASAIIGDFESRFSKGIAALRVKGVGGFFQDRALMVRMVKELYNVASGDPRAVTIAKLWEEGGEELRARFNDAGGDIRLRRDWRIPQGPSRGLVMAESEARWLEVAGKYAKVWDEDAGAYVTPSDDLLRGIRQNIALGTPEGLEGVGQIGARHTDPRVLHFETFEDWQGFHDVFGNPDVFSQIIGHVHRRAREIAIMEELGPIPVDAVTMLKGEVAQQVAKQEPGGLTKHLLRAGWAPDRVKFAVNDVGRLWSSVSGEDQIPFSVAGAQIAGSVRQLLSAAQLGSAPLSAVQDMAPMTSTAKFNGLPAAQMLGRFLRNLTPGSDEAIEFGIRLGIGSTSWTDALYSGTRFYQDLGGPGMFRGFSDTVFRLSGLNKWTDAARVTFGTEFMGRLGSEVGRSMAEIAGGNEADQAFARAMKRYGITAEDWDVVRAMPTEGHKGAQYLLLQNLRDTDLPPAARRELSVKFLTMVQREADIVISRPDAEVRAYLHWGTQPGTIGGEVMRAVTMYKSFSITMMMNHYRRALEQPAIRGRVGYLASMIIGSTLLGGMSVQGHLLAKGLKPLDMDDPEFWKKALWQGGGLGIMGDFVNNLGGVGRYGQGLVPTLVGPMAGLLDDTATGVRDLTEGNYVGAFNKAVRYVPGSNLWYTRLMTDRIVWDSVRQMMDPYTAYRGYRTSERYWLDQGTEFYWPPGQMRPGSSGAGR